MFPGVSSQAEALSRKFPGPPSGPAEQECRSIGSSVGFFRGADQRVEVKTQAGQVSVLLPGSDWCEIRMGPRFARTFLNVAPRVEMWGRRPDATIWQMHSVFFQMGAFALKPGGAAAESPELLRDAFEEAIRSGTGESEGFLAFARRPNVHREWGVRDTGGRCLPLQMTGPALG